MTTQLTPLAEANATSYDERARRHGRRVSRRVVLSQKAGYARRVQRFAAFLGLGPEHRLIEFGAGIGTLTLPLAALGCKVTATDIASGELEVLQENASTLGLSDRVTVARGEPASLPEEWLGRFDFALTSSVLHHVDEPSEFVAGMARFVRPGGWCGGIEPNAASPTMRLIQELGFMLPGYVLGSREAERNFPTSREENLLWYANTAGLRGALVKRAELLPRPLVSRLPALSAVEDALTRTGLTHPVLLTLFWKAMVREKAATATPKSSES